jgi:arginine N-succinyltransferase
MLMAQHPERFAPDVIAELRGVIDEKGESPFWNDIGAHFFGMSYDEADQLCGKGSNQFITELMPKHPIYTNLLSVEARKSLGRPHQATKRAMELLLAEGFEYESLIDIFDAGPLVRARIDQIKSVRNVRQANVVQLEESVPVEVETSMILANRSLDRIRIVYQPAIAENIDIKITPETMKALDVQVGDQIMLIDDSGT